MPSLFVVVSFLVGSTFVDRHVGLTIRLVAVGLFYRLYHIQQYIYYIILIDISIVGLKLIKI